MQIPRAAVQIDRLPVGSGGAPSPFINLDAPQHSLSEGGQANRARLQLAGALGDAGGAMARVAERETIAREETRLLGATTNATRALNDLSAKFATDPSWQNMGDRWDEAVAGVRDQYRGGLTVSETQRAFDERFAALAEAKRATISQRALSLQVDEHRSLLDQQALDAASRVAAANPLERALIVQQYQHSLQDAAAAGLIGRQDVVDRNAKFLGSLDEAEARSAITADPERALLDLLDTKRWGNLDPVLRTSLADSAHNRAESLAAQRIADVARRDAAARQVQKDYADGLAKVGFGLALDGKLDRVWLDGHQNDLNLEDYKVLAAKLDPANVAPVRSVPHVVIDIANLMDTDPTDAVRAAKQAYLNGQISEDDLNRYRTEGQNRLDDLGKPQSTYLRAVDAVKAIFVQSQFGPRDPSMDERQVQALRDLQDRTIGAGMNANDKAIDAIAEDLKTRYRDKSAAMLPALLYGLKPVVPKNSGDARSQLDSVNAYARSLLARTNAASPEALALGMLTPAQVARESEVLQQWRAWLTNAALSGAAK